MNFQVWGKHEDLLGFEIGVAWTETIEDAAPPSANVRITWQLMFHLDRKAASWPNHPERHIQFTSSPPPSAPPFVEWRLPFGESDPARLIEYLVAHVAR